VPTRSNTLAQTDSRCRPLARRRAITARPLLVRILARKPWVRWRLMLLGWNVLLLMISPLASGPGRPETVWRERWAPGF